MASKDTVALFLISLVSLSGIFAILAFSHENAMATGQISFIDTILDIGKRQVNELFKTTKTVQEKITEPVTEEKYGEELEEELLEEPSEELVEKPQLSLDYSVVGSWRPHFQGIFYDNGASNYIKKPVTRKLTIYEDGSWEFGSTGTWEVKEITPEDWERWKISPYEAATKKIILYNWNENTAEGPIDDGIEGVDFIWVMYRSEKLSLGPATINIKFGH